VHCHPAHLLISSARAGAADCGSAYPALLVAVVGTVATLVAIGMTTG
jgi:hypothetical protein